MPYPYKTFREWFADEEKLGNVIRLKTPIKCGDYNNIVDQEHGIPGKIPETELRALCRYFHSLPGKPMGIIENPVNNRPDIPVIVNPWATRERTLRSMGFKDKDELCRKYGDVLKNKIKPVKVSKGEALCKQVIIPEEQVDLMKDIPRCWVEFNQFLWSGCNGIIITYDPETKSHNLGKLRAGQFDWKDGNPNDPYPEEKVKKQMIATMGTPMYSHMASNTGRYYYYNYRLKNKPMPCIYTFGLPGDIHQVASYRKLLWPETGDEYEILGGFRGNPLEVVESETIPGLMVPAHAEWVIEGEFLPEDIVTPPYGEDFFAGIMLGGMTWPVFRVKCITHRKEPWWTATTFSSSGLHGHEGTHTGLAVLNTEAEAVAYLRDVGFKVKDVVMIAGSLMVVQLDIDGAAKPYPHYGKKVAMALAADGMWGLAAKFIIVVGPDIDPYDGVDVLWALALRVQPVSDTIVVEKGLGLDPVTVRGQLEIAGEQVMIDALIKVPERHDTWPPRSEPPDWEREAIKRMKEKLG